MKSSSILVNKNSITSIAIGGFDGMHVAHKELFKKLDENGAIVAIESGYSNITPKTHRQDFVEFPVYCYLLENIKHLTGKAFIKLIKEEFANLKTIVVGFDFHFGKFRENSAEELKELFDGEVIIVDEVKVDDVSVHSRTIRNYIQTGEFKTVSKFLGREYKIAGTQIKGQGLGSKEFVPTINLRVNDFLLPSEGVYLTKTILEDIEYNSITFIGHRVSTDGSYAIETHILDKNIQNKEITVHVKFIEKIRNNKKFRSFEELKKQIDLDILDAKNYFK